jgi:hypothetical protein
MPPPEGIQGASPLFQTFRSPLSSSLSRSEGEEIYRYPESIRKDGSGKKSACEIKNLSEEVNPVRNSNPA